MGSKIVDLSKWQQGINWAKLAKDVKFVILRVQDGSLADIKYNEYAGKCKAHGIPFGVYAFCRYTSEAGARKEATNFFNRSRVNGHRPNFYFLDCEVATQTRNARATEAYRKQLKDLGVDKIGVYIAHHLRGASTIDFSKFDKVWIPRYGGLKPAFACDLWQHTEHGRVDGYSGGVDLNTIVRGGDEWYLTGGGVTALAKETPVYFKENKREVKAIADSAMYNSLEFTAKNKVGTVRKGDVFKDVKAVKNGDITRFQLSNGRKIFISSSSEVVKPVFYDNEDKVKKVQLLEDQDVYKDKDFKVKAGKFKKGEEFNIEKVEFNKNGTPRLYAKGKVYLSARKNKVKKVK